MYTSPDLILNTAEGRNEYLYDNLAEFQNFITGIDVLHKSQRS